METLWTTLRRRPLRFSLLLLQLFASALVMTLALSAALSSRTPAAPPERFDLIAGSESEGGSSTYSLFSPSDLPELQALTPDVARLALAAEMYEPTVVAHGTRYAFRSGARVSEGFFELEPLTLTRGSLFTDAEIRAGEPVVLLSEGAAETLFGGGEAVGQTLAVEAEAFRFDPENAPPPTPHRVVGTFTLEATDRFGGAPAILFPFPAAASPDVFLQPASTLSALAQPGRGEAARAQLLSAARQRYADELQAQGAEAGGDFMVRAPGENPFGPRGVDQDVLIFGLFGVVALMVSSIALFSVTVLEAEERAFEIGVRRALGASAARVGRALVLRSVALALVGGAAGILAAALLAPLLAGPARGAMLFSGGGLAFDPLAALTVLAVMGTISGLLGLFPALRISRLKPVQALREAP